MSVHVAFVLRAADTYVEQPPQRSTIGGHMVAAVHLRGDGYGYTTIQGTPADVRRLASELLDAAAAAEQWDIDHPAEQGV